VERALRKGAGRYLAVTGRLLIINTALALAATSAEAALVTWELKGTITDSKIAPAPDAPNIPVGTPFRLLVTYDTAVPYTTRGSTPDPDTGQPRSGTRYQYFGAPGLKFALYAGDCNPCTPANIPERNGVLVRDDFGDPDFNPPPDVQYDGYTFYMNAASTDDNTDWQVIFRDQSTRFSPHIVNVTTGANPLPIEPDQRLTQMAESVLNISNKTNGDFVRGRIESVGTPTYGTAYILTARDCSYPDWVFDPFFNRVVVPGGLSDDCFSNTRSGGYNRYINEGGGPGQGDFSIVDNVEFPVFTTSPPAARRSLGSVFGSVTFGGPSALPVVKASSYPIDVARTNGNIQGYQQYRYSGTVKTQMPLVADLTYKILDNRVKPTNLAGGFDSTGLYPGVGSIAATLAIIDGNLISAADMANAGFGHRTCGSEGDKDQDGNLLVTRADGSPWPAGAIMGTAAYNSAAFETGDQARIVKLVRCAKAGEEANADGTVKSGAPVELQPNQSFFAVTTLQTPARGNWQQAANQSAPPLANGYADAGSTLRVTIDPQASPAVVQQFVQSVDPACTDCEFTTDERVFRIDVRPGSSDNPIQPTLLGTIPVAIFGSVGLPVDWINASSLRLGKLMPNLTKAGKPQCAKSDVDLDGIPDLVCHFRNEAANWKAGQNTVTLTGNLSNSEPLIASDTIRIVP
jgi:hypothetical protein